ncbi:hypothetical protein [Ferrovibrio sp.]|uniref:hypothetical protein n=1 Tax=Ferrovibrio sp. TaxID=1917215 RepID=UPI003D281E32
MPMPFIEPSYPVNTEVAALRTAELFGMAAFRLWAAPYLEPGLEHPDWRQGFAAAGIGCGGLGGFDTLMLLLTSAAVRPLEVRCLQCKSLSGDEGLFLQLLSHLQQSRADLAAAVLGQWLPCAWRWSRPRRWPRPWPAPACCCRAAVRLMQRIRCCTACMLGRSSSGYIRFMK